MPRRLPENIQWRAANSSMHKRFPYLGFTTCGRWYVQRPQNKRGVWKAYRGEHPTSLDGEWIYAESLGALSDKLSRFK